MIVSPPPKAMEAGARASPTRLHRRRHGSTMSKVGLASLLKVASCTKEKEHLVLARLASYPNFTEFMDKLGKAMEHADGHQESMEYTCHLNQYSIEPEEHNTFRTRSPASLDRKSKLQPLARSESACSVLATHSLIYQSYVGSPTLMGGRRSLPALDGSMLARSDTASVSLCQKGEISSRRRNTSEVLTEAGAEGNDAAREDMNQPGFPEPPSSSQSADRNTSKDKPRKRTSVPRQRRRSSSSSAGLPPRLPPANSDKESALGRKERLAAFEENRLQNAQKHDQQLCKLLKVHQAELAQDINPPNNVAQRKAAYEAQRQDAKKLHQENVQRSKDLIRARLSEWNPSEEFVQQAIAKLLSVSGLDRDQYCAGREVTSEMVEKCCDETKHKFFMGPLADALEGEGIKSETWRTAFIQEIISIRSIGDLTEAERQGGFLTMICDTVEQLSDAGSTALACSICMDPLVSVSLGRLDTSKMWFAPLRKNEHWSNHPCGHTFCRSCMKAWSETAINEHKLRIKCPAEKCCYSLMEQDLSGLVSNTVFNRYLEYKHADYLQNLQAISSGDKQFMQWLRTHARPCPSCHVIVSRSEGCNVMTCVCGMRFCYACGCAQCQCGKKKRDDIWSPQT